MNHTEFFACLAAGELHGLLLFHGPEEYIKQSALSALAGSVDAAMRELNVQTFEKPQAEAIRSACETLPFFADRRIIICQDMADAEIKLLLPYAPTLPDTALLVLAVRGACGEALRKQIVAVGKEVLFDTLSEPDALRFVQDRARKRGARMDRRVAALLVDMVGTDVHTLENELFKVIDYAGGDGALLLEDFVTTVITPNPEYQRYRMLDDLLAGRTRQGMRALEGMLQDGSESVFGLAHFFTGQCKNMLSARLLLDGGVRERDIAARLKLYSKAARSATLGAGRLPAAALRDAVLEFSRIDYLQVSGRMDGAQALTLAVARYFS